MLTDSGKTEKDSLFGVWFIHPYPGTLYVCDEEGAGGIYV